MARSRDIVYRGYDPVEVELVEAQLRAAGMPYVRLGRGNAAMLGVGNYIVEQLIEVADEHGDEARALVAAARGSDVVDELEASDPARGVPSLGPDRSRARAREHLTALGLTLVFPGLASSYVGFPLVGLAVLGWSLFVMLGVNTSPNPAAGILLSQVATRVIELVATQRHLRRAGRTRPGIARQVIVALFCLTLLQASYCGAAARPPLRAPRASAAQARAR